MSIREFFLGYKREVFPGYKNRIVSFLEIVDGLEETPI